jgi:Ala-tRNA(Pro) deacylase
MDIYSFLKSNNITYDRYDHPAVFTIEESLEHVPPLPGAKIKNLFLCDKKGHRHFLVVTSALKSVDLKKLAEILAVKKLRFGSSERLQRMLGLIPGAVTPLAVLNDSDHQVEVIIDSEVLEQEAVQCHPLVNTSTLLITIKNLKVFFDATGHLPRSIDIPASK